MNDNLLIENKKRGVEIETIYKETKSNNYHFYSFCSINFLRINNN